MTVVLPHRRKSFRGSAFSPADIAGLCIWLDANTGVKDNGGDDASDGEGIRNWEDQSGLGNDPDVLNNTEWTYRTSGPHCEFAGVSGSPLDWATNPCYGEAETTIFAVLNGSTVDATVIMGGSGGQPGDNAYVAACQNGSGSTALSYVAGSPTYYANGAELISPTRDTLWDNFIDTGASPVVVSIHDVEMLNGRWTSFGWMGYDTSSAWNLDGDIYELLLYDSALSTADREAVEIYLGDKWGISITH